MAAPQDSIFSEGTYKKIIAETPLQNKSRQSIDQKLKTVDSDMYSLDVHVPG